MGQQQLLLLVLGIVIVGIAVVAGIQAFSEGKTKADRDAAVSDAMRIISDIQAWKLKPSAFGGGASATGFNTVSYGALGVTDTTNAGHYTTFNGCFELTPGADATLVVKGDTSCAANTDIATVTISGTKAEDIDWAY